MRMQSGLLKEQLNVVKYRDADTGAARYTIRPVDGQLTFDKVGAGNASYASYAWCASRAVAWRTHCGCFAVSRSNSGPNQLLRVMRRGSTCLCAPSSSCSSASMASSW